MSLDSVSMATVSLYGVQGWGPFIIGIKCTFSLVTTDLLRQLHRRPEHLCDVTLETS